jgi:hypothetical protein
MARAVAIALSAAPDLRSSEERLRPELEKKPQIGNGTQSRPVSV